jgi:predicted MFS family arabinose efflux permease
MAWYNLGGCIACAFGSLGCGFLLQHLQREYHIENGILEFKIVLTVYAAVQAILLMCFFSLSSDVEVQLDDVQIKSTNPAYLFLGLHHSKQIILKLSVLFMIDAFAGSFVIQSLITDWFFLEFNTRPEDLGSILFICNLVAGVSALLAAQLAESIGLIMTMVVTHVPSNVLLILVPLMPSQSLAIVILCLRFCISQMDVPTRNAYVQGVVSADERSAANGITNIVRSIGAATGPMLSGILFANPTTRNYPFYIAGILKIIYDVLLLWNFKGVKSASDRRY